MIYQEVSKSEFIQTMIEFGFSYEGAAVLFDYYTEISEETGKDIEFDPVAINCDWVELDSIGEAQEEYGETDETIELENGRVLVTQY